MGSASSFGMKIFDVGYLVETGSANLFNLDQGKSPVAIHKTQPNNSMHAGIYSKVKTCFFS
jgi:hypothetical protein